VREELGNLKRYLYSKVLDLWWAVSYGRLMRSGTMAEIENCSAAESTPVELYWNEHTVHSRPFVTASQSKRYLEWRFSIYPLFREFMQLYGEHRGETILDYGCGPGDDMTGFAIYSRARKIIGCDVSEKALRLAQHRLALHQVDPERLRLIHISDSLGKLPLEDSSVDYVHCAGVLHHVSEPEYVLSEFYRILKPNSSACVMVYNYHSLWLHLYTAYDKMILQDAFPGLTLEQAFAKNTDGEDCPISNCYSPENFINICNRANFQVGFVGGYLSSHELDLLTELGARAVADSRLGEEHKKFLRDLKYDEQGYPIYKNKHAGIGGVYRLYKN
jgi:SAM-dependent methyltransferase